MAKLFFLDLETTGTDPQKNGIIQIGGIIRIDGELREIINFRVQPFENDAIDEEALEVTGHTKEELFSDEIIKPADAYKHLMSILGNYVDKFDRNDKFQLVGYNGKFDDDFLRAWFRKLGDSYYGSWFSFPIIDVCTQAAVHFIGKRHTLKNFKLMTVAKALGFEVDENGAHDAMYDIKITQKMFYKLAKNQLGIK